MIYLDYAAATPLKNEVKKAMEPFFSEHFYNPSATYLAGQLVKKELEAARQNIARNLGVRASEIIFTAGGTEANNLAIHGVMARYPDAEVACLAIEHDSVLEPVKNYTHTFVGVHSDGQVDLDELRSKITDKTVLVSVGMVNNEIGTIQPLSEVANMLNEVRTVRNTKGNSLPIYLHTDACQAGNYLSLQVSKLGVDMMTINGGKLYGPKQSGALFVRAGIELEPLIVGGGQEFGRRSGTENVAQAVGLATAVELAQKLRAETTTRMHELQTHFYKQLQSELPQVVINGSTKQRVANNVHVTVPDADNERRFAHTKA